MANKREPRSLLLEDPVAIEALDFRSTPRRCAPRDAVGRLWPRDAIPQQDVLLQLQTNGKPPEPPLFSRHATVAWGVCLRLRAAPSPGRVRGSAWPMASPQLAEPDAPLGA